MTGSLESLSPLRCSFFSFRRLFLHCSSAPIVSSLPVRLAMLHLCGLVAQPRAANHSVDTQPTRGADGIGSLAPTLADPESVGVRRLQTGQLGIFYWETGSDREIFQIGWAAPVRRSQRLRLDVSRARAADTEIRVQHFRLMGFFERVCFIQMESFDNE